MSLHKGRQGTHIVHTIFSSLFFIWSTKIKWKRKFLLEYIFLQSGVKWIKCQVVCSLMNTDGILMGLWEKDKRDVEIWGEHWRRIIELELILLTSLDGFVDFLQWKLYYIFLKIIWKISDFFYWHFFKFSLNYCHI